MSSSEVRVGDRTSSADVKSSDLTHEAAPGSQSEEVNISCGYLVCGSAGLAARIEVPIA